MLLSAFLSVVLVGSPSDSAKAFKQNRWLIGIDGTLNRMKSYEGGSMSLNAVLPHRPGIGVHAGYQLNATNFYLNAGLTYQITVYTLKELKGTRLNMEFFDRTRTMAFATGADFEVARYEPGCFVELGKRISLKDSTALCLEAGVGPYLNLGKFNAGELSFGVGVSTLRRKIQFSAVPSVCYDVSPSWRYSVTSVQKGTHSVVRRHPLRFQLSFTWGL